jgi:sec-independent protein translocase protein TatB
MFGIGFLEIAVIVVFALIFVGPKRIPEVARQIGKFFVQFRRITNEVRSSVETVIHQAEEEVRREQREALQALLTAPKINEDLKDQIDTTTPDHLPTSIPYQHDAHVDLDVTDSPNENLNGNEKVGATEK